MWNFINTEAPIYRCSTEKPLWKKFANSQKNTCVGVFFWWSCRSVVCSSKRLRHRCLALVFKNFFNTIILRNIRWRLSVHNPPNKQFLFTFDSYYLKNSLIFLFEVNLVLYKSAAAEVKLLVQKVHEKHKMTITETALDQVIYYWSATWTKTASLKDFPWLFKGGLNCLLKEERALLLILKLMEIANVKINKPFFFVLKLSIHLFENYFRFNQTEITKCNLSNF